MTGEQYYTLLQGDCLDIMEEIDDETIDLILCDLPYGVTACPWDSPIDLDSLWAHYKRIIKPNRPIVLTATQPFATTLIYSNIEWFKYEWIWVKNRPTNFAHAKNKPMRKHENVLVFSEGSTVHASQSERRMPYNPQGLVELEKPQTVVKSEKEKTDVCFQTRSSHGEFERKYTNYPHTILEFSTDMGNYHPTAKPVALMEYLILTYSEPGDIVLDNTMGSASTGIGCLNTGRLFLGIELDEHYFQVARDRMDHHFLQENNES